MAEKTQAPDVGARIAEARLARGFSQTDLAIRGDWALRTVQAWEGNDRTPRLPALRRVAEITGRPVSWFYEIESVGENGSEPEPDLPEAA